MAILKFNDEPADIEEILDESRSTAGENGILLATDMDGTMFKNDLGLLVFLEKLSDPRLWEFDADRFSTLLLPPKYRKAMGEGKDGLHDRMPPEICALGLDLHADIVRLYELIKFCGKDPKKSKEIPRLVNEFARKMMELDRIFMKLDRYLSSFFRGQLLMRTRFFAGKEPKDIRRLTELVMSHSVSSAARLISLCIHEENRREAGQTVTEERIRNVHDEESPLRQIDRLVIPVDNVRRLIRKAIEELNIHAVVLTANLHGIADTAIYESPDYRFLKDQTTGKIVVGSRLRTNGKKLEPKLDGTPVFGERKAVEARLMARTQQRKYGISIGDSPGTDGPMMNACLAEGGSVFIVTEKPERALKDFSEALEIENAPPETCRRIYRITPNGNSK